MLHKQMASENGRLKDIIQDRESVLDRFTQQLEKQTIDLSARQDHSERLLQEKEEQINRIEKEKSELQHNLVKNEQTLANLKKLSNKEYERLKEKVDNYKKKVKIANQRMLMLKKNLLGSEVEKIVGTDVTQGLNLDPIKKNKVKDAFRDAGY